ncbi:MAG: thiamine diphosphokinase [Hyphomicrobiales bacterium]
MTRFAILLGGNLTVTARLRRQITGARVIAADSGIAHAAALGVDPELWVGDFDSSSSELLLQYRHVPRQSHKPEKDATDGELAVAEALKRGGRDFALVGGFGGQADHLLGHFGLALRLARAGHASLLTSGGEEAYPLIPGVTEIDLAPESRISIIPFADLAGLDLQGVRWPLTKRDVPLGSSLTLSNIAHGRVRISLAGGYGMAIAYPAAHG